MSIPEPRASFNANPGCYVLRALPVPWYRMVLRESHCMIGLFHACRVMRRLQAIHLITVLRLTELLQLLGISVGFCRMMLCIDQGAHVRRTGLKSLDRFATLQAVEMTG